MFVWCNDDDSNVINDYAQYVVLQIEILLILVLYRTFK